VDELLLLAVRPNGALTYNDIAKDEFNWDSYSLAPHWEQHH